MKTIQRFGKNIFELIKETLTAWQADKASRLAAALAYYAIFSIAPLLMIIIAIIALVFGERAAKNEIAGQLQVLVGPDAAGMIQTMIASMHNRASGIWATIIGTLTIVLGASGLFGQVQSALDTIWHALPPKKGNVLHLVKERLIHFAMVLGMGALLLLSLFTGIAATAITNYFNVGSLLQTVNIVTSFVLIMLLFAIIYKALPSVKIAWWDVWIGSAVTSVLFTLGKLFIDMYMANSSIGSAYGAAGSLVVLLVWVYYSAQIFLLGAEFTHVYAKKFGSMKKTPATTDVSFADL